MVHAIVDEATVHDQCDYSIISKECTAAQPEVLWKIFFTQSKAQGLCLWIR